MKPGKMVSLIIFSSNLTPKSLTINFYSEKLSSQLFCDGCKGLQNQGKTKVKIS